MIFREPKAADKLGLSLRTLQRLRHDGSGPVFTKLTERRIGYTEQALQDWLKARVVMQVPRTGKPK